MTALFTGRGSLRHLTCLLATMLTPATALSQELIVHLPLDGSIENAGSAGTAELVGPAPTTVQGQIGSAMKFDGEVIAVPVDLSSTQVSRLTVTAWVKADTNAPETNHWIVSSGTQGTTPFLRLLKRRQGIKAEIRGGRASLLSEDFSPSGEWVFVAGTVDIPAQQLRMQQDDTGYQRDGIRTDSLYDASTHVNPNNPDSEPRAWVFIGARTFNLSLGATAGIAIDDVRIYDDVLSPSQLANIKDGGGQTVADAGVDLPGQPDGDLTMPDRQSPTDDILAERQGADSGSDGDIQRIEPPDGIGTGSDTGSDEPTLTTGARDKHQLPDRDEIEQQATDVARREALAQAAEREEAERRQALREEEERQRQEQEDAEEEERESVHGEGRIGVGTLTVEPGEIPEGIRNLQIASGEGHRTAISGWEETAGQLKVDLRHYAIHTIAWYEEGDRPCEVVVTAYAPGANTSEAATGRTEACNGDGGNQRSRKVVTLQPYGGVITGLQVCFRGYGVIPGMIAIPPDGRVKGLDIKGRHFTADGKLKSKSYSATSATNPNCQEWQNLVDCPSGQIATGLVNHLKKTSSDNYYISGMQLICREVVD